MSLKNGTVRSFHIDGVNIACILRDIDQENLHFIDYWNNSFTKDRTHKTWTNKIHIPLSKLLFLSFVL